MRKSRTLCFMSYAAFPSNPTTTPRNFRQASRLSNNHLTIPVRFPKRISPRRAAIKQSSGKYPIIVHSHLRWDWVWQRPQQFVSRLSRRHKVLFVETFSPDPQLATPLARFQTPENFPNITLLQLQFPLWRWEAAAYVDTERRRIVQEFVTGPLAGEMNNPVQWFYDPTAITAFGGHV